MKLIRAPGASFAALVGLGAVLELGAALGLWLGVQSVARCSWRWFPTAAHHTAAPGVCMEPLPVVGFHLFVPVGLLGALLGVSVVVGARATWQSIVRTRRFRRAMGPLLEGTGPLRDAARAAGDVQVELHHDDRLYACCVGMVHPTVVVSSAVLALLSFDELVAVIAHEHRHQRRYAPLRAVVARGLVAGLFWVPVLGTVNDKHLADEEIVADAEACGVAGAKALLGALVKLADPPVLVPGSAIGGADTLPARIEALRAGHGPGLHLPRLRLRALAVVRSVVGVLLVGALLWWMPVGGSGIGSAPPTRAVPVPAPVRLSRSPVPDHK